MHKITQGYYDMIMDYVGLNQRSVGLLSTTKLTGLVRWHKRNHELYDDYNEWFTKWIGNYYDVYAEPKMVETYNYTVDGNIDNHLNSWYNALMPMKKKTMELYEESKEKGDGIMACKFLELNKVVVNECFQLKRLMRRLKSANETDLMIVNKIIHDYFQENPKCKEIDLSL